MSDLGTFRIDIQLENPARPGTRLAVSSVLVDPGAGLTWIPGSILGARALEGLNLRVDSVSKRLMNAGPVPAAAAA